MKQTDNHKLNKPDYTDAADIADINANMDIIDANLGKVTTPAYTDTKGNKYTDINGMHLRTDNAIYAKGGIKIVNVDPCTDGGNLTEEMVSGTTVNLYVLAKIDENGNAVFKELEASNLDVNSISTDKIVVDSTALQRLAIHFSKAKGAMFIDNSSNNKSDGSRKFIVGVYKDIPQTDSNNMPTTLPDAGIRTRVESDENGNGTYVELYGDNVVCRTEGAVFKVSTLKADIIRADKELKIGNASVSELLSAKADTEHNHKKVTSDYIEYTHTDSLPAGALIKIAEVSYNENMTSIVSDIILGTKYKSNSRNIETAHARKFSLAISAIDMFYYSSGTGIYLEQLYDHCINPPFNNIKFIKDSNKNVHICLEVPTPSTGQSDYVAERNNYKISVSVVNYLNDGINIVTPSIFDITNTDVILLTEEIKSK